MAQNIGDLLNQIDTKPEPKVYSKSVLSNQTKRKLFSYQEKHVIKLIITLLENKIALDNSDTGTGKTYSACAVTMELERRPIIICPKTLIYSWSSVCEYFGIRPYDIVNYETIKNGKTYKDNKFIGRKKNKFMNIIESGPENPQESIYQWKLPKDAIIIVDESHRCKDPSTDNGKFLMSLKQAIKQKIPVLLLSATICEKFNDMKIPFYLFGFIPSTRNYKHYIESLWNKYPQYKVKRKNFKSITEYRTVRENSQALVIYDEIKNYTSRIKIKDLGNKFPSNQWCAQQFVAEESNKISEAYEQIAICMKKLKENPGQNDLAKIQKLRQEIELRKVPIFIEQAKSYLEEGKSVIIFVNYLHTFDVLVDELEIKCKVYGKQTLEERKESIDMFQSNQEKIIICQIRAGGVGIGLHDIHGGHPRVTLVNYPESAADLLQALGRAPRAGAKSPVLQRIIFVANVEYEKKIAQRINRKLANISAINDGDLDGYKYELRKITKKKKIVDV